MELSAQPPPPPVCRVWRTDGRDCQGGNKVRNERVPRLGVGIPPQGANECAGFLRSKTCTLRQNMYGLAGGGPLSIPKLYNGKNRSFIYAAWEGYRQRLYQQTGALAPSDAMRAGDSGSCARWASRTEFCNDPKGQIYDPFTTTFNGASDTYSRAPFLDNIIPADRISPISQAFQNFIPHAGTLANGSNLFVPGRSATNQDSGTIRGDQYIGNSDQITFPYERFR